MILTLAEYKTLAGITDASSDARITALIPIVQDAIIQFCNNDWGSGTVSESFPEGLKGPAVDMITYKLSGLSVSRKKSESIDGYSYTMDEVGSSGYPMAVEKSLEAYRAASFKKGTVQNQWRDKRP